MAEALIQSKEIINKEELNYNLTLKNIKTNYYVKINKASLGQLILCMNYLGIENPKNVFQQKFHNIFLRKRVQEFVEVYTEILKCESQEEKEVKAFNLTGPLPKGLYINQKLTKHGSSFINKAKLGDIIQALYQRTNFIIERPVPKFYDNLPEQKKYFLKMQSQIKDFIVEIEKLEEDFGKALTLCTKLQEADDLKKSMYKKK